MAKRHKRAEGGKTPKGKMQMYNAQGSKAAAAAEDETPEFKKGGVAKKKKDHEKLKSGGAAEGKMAAMRADKKPRGEHHKRAAGGRTPYSSGHETSMPKGDNNGHESERPGAGPSSDG
jgi:hypothetical protein